MVFPEILGCGLIQTSTPALSVKMQEDIIKNLSHSGDFPG